MLLATMLLCASPAVGGIEGQIRSMIRAADLRDTHASMAAIDVDTGRTLAQLNADDPMMPASNMKLVTTAAALDLLGPDFVFRTTLMLNDPQTPDHGATITVRGDGDPAFGDPKILAEHKLDVEDILQLWVKAVVDAGIKRVDRLVIDDRAFDNQFVHPTWPSEQLNQWYCAQVSGLNFYDNCFDVIPEPTTAGNSPIVALVPTAAFVPVTNRAVTGSADTFWISRRTDTNELTFWGKIHNRRTSAYHVTMHDPAMTFGQIFAERLEKAGVKVAAVQRQGSNDRPAAGRTLHVVQTTLWEVVKRCNKDSQNLFAESLLKRLGRHVTGVPGSWDSGAAAVRMFLQKRLGPAGSAINIADGSGLSRDNRVTARALVGLLTSMRQDPLLGPAYVQSLSQAGEDGTLRKRLRNGIAGEVYAKTGYINGVSTLSGYIIFPTERDDGAADADQPDAATRPGRTIAFSLLFNDIQPPVYPYKVKALQDSIVRLLNTQLIPQDR